MRLVNRDDVQAKYHLSNQLLSDYESWRVKQVDGQLAPSTYTVEDIEKLRLMFDLQQIGFLSQEIEDFLGLKLQQQVPPAKLIALLTQRRREKLTTIHHFEQQIASIDYLKFQLMENH